MPGNTFCENSNCNQHFVRKELKLLWKNPMPTELSLQNLQGRTLWKKIVLPGQLVTLPKFRGCQSLFSNGQLLDRWITH